MQIIRLTEAILARAMTLPETFRETADAKPATITGPAIFAVQTLIKIRTPRRGGLRLTNPDARRKP
ncbi:MAG: hypothetical protein ACOH2H_24835 [Cypionkella sp.]